MSAAVLTDTLADVIRNVRAIFTQAGDGTLIQTGVEFRETFKSGQAPRILFEPEVGGKAGPVLQIGDREIGSFSSGCIVRIRGAEDGTDDGRFDSAYQTANRVRNALQASASGRLAWKAWKDSSPVGVDGYFGAEVIFAFEYTWANRYDDDIMNAAYALATAAGGPASPGNPDQPNGPTGLNYSVAITHNPSRAS